MDILPASQRQLWPELDAVPADFVLYGGTGLALQLGHRVSEDFDFFSSSGFGLDTLRRVEDPRRADIHTLGSHGIDLPTGLAAAKAIDGNFNPVTSVRALQFYGDGTLGRVPAAMQRDLIRWAQAVDVTSLPVLNAKGDLSFGGGER